MIIAAGLVFGMGNNAAIGIDGSVAALAFVELAVYALLSALAVS